MEFKKMDIEKIDSYVDIYIDVFSRSPWFIREDPKDIKSYFLKYFKLNNFLGYEVLKDSRLVGFTLGYKKPWITGYEYYIDQFSIAFNYQNMGLGRSLLKYIEDQSVKEDIVNIILLTDKNTRAYKFYKRSGFTRLKSSSLLVKELENGL